VDNMRKCSSKLQIKYEIIVDGRLLGVLWESAKTRKELKRLRQLGGIEIKGPLYVQ